MLLLFDNNVVIKQLQRYQKNGEETLSRTKKRRISFILRSTFRIFAT